MNAVSTCPNLEDCMSVNSDVKKKISLSLSLSLHIKHCFLSYTLSLWNGIWLIRLLTHSNYVHFWLLWRASITVLHVAFILSISHIPCGLWDVFLSRWFFWEKSCSGLKLNHIFLFHRIFVYKIQILDSSETTGILSDFKQWLVFNFCTPVYS